MSGPSNANDLDGRSRGLLWLALALPLGIAALVAAVTLAGGPAARSTSLPSPSPRSGFPTLAGQSFPSPPAAFPVRPPPIDRDLIWRQLPQDKVLDAIRIRAADWSGREVGTLALPCPAPCSVIPSPDGRRLLVQPDVERPVGPDGAKTLVHERSTLYDTTGAVIGHVESTTDALLATWADDSRHLCVLRSLGRPEGQPGQGSVQLELLDPGTGTARVVAAVDGGEADFWGVDACSVATDRAVLSARRGDGERAVRVVQLSTGRLVYSRDDLPIGDPSALPVDSLTVSSNGAVAVEHLSTGGVRVRDLSTGTVTPWPAASALPSEILGLSAQGLRAVTAGGVVDLASGRTVWRAPSAMTFGAARPGSDDLVLSVGGHGLLLLSDGSVVPLPAGYT